MASFRGIVNVAWDAGPAGLVVDEKCKWKRLKCLLNPNGGEHHNQARECICRPRILSDEACSPETVRELFEECSGLLTLAQLDASITESAGTTDNAVVGRLRDAVVAFMTCKILMGESWQSSQPYSSLLGTLKSLAEVLIQAAHARVYRTKEPTQQNDSSKTFNIKFADPLIRQQEPSEFMLFGTLSKAAWIYADSALSGSPPQEATFSSQGINATFTCCALVYACKLLGDLTETLAKRPDLLAAFNPADKNRPKPKPKPKPEPPGKVQKERKASSFLDKVEGEWSRAILHHDPMQTCTSVWERRPGFLDDASNLCEGFKLSDSDEDFEADGLIFRELFHDPKDKLGRALWEIFHRDCCDPYIKAVAEKTKATVKVLMQCMAKDEKWVASEQLGNLSLRVRLMTEALATAAFMRFCYEKEEDLIKPNNKQGHKKGLSKLAGDMMKPTAPPEARILGALCKAAHNTVCDAHLHYKPSPDLHYKPLPNRGDCIIIGCRAIVFACCNFIKVMDLPNVQDTNPEEPVALGSAAQSNLSAEGSAAMQGRHVAGRSQAYEARFKAFLTDLQAQTEAPVDPRPHFSIFKDKFLKLEDMYSQAHNARGDVESTLGTLHNSFGDGIFLGDFSSDQIQKNKIITAAQDIYRTSVNYVTNIDTGEWLYRVLTDEDDKHYKNIGEKLAKLVSLLREAMCKKDWPPQDKENLVDFEQKVAGLESRKDHAVARQKVRQAFKDQAVYLKELQEFFDDSKEAVLRECCKKMTEEKLKQAAAFARAKFDRSGTHHEIHHPDLLVLWHRGNELKQKWHAGWGEFLSHFPSKIWLEKEVRSKVEAMKHNLRHPLTGASSEEDEESSAEPQVSIDSINRVFEWRVGKRVALLDAVKSCQSNLQSKASSEGTRTPGKGATPLGSGKLDLDSWQDFAGFFEEEVQGPALLGRDETIAQATDILMRTSGKRHLLLRGPGGIGKSSLGEAISHQLVDKGYFAETGIIRIDLFTARSADSMNAALSSGLSISGKAKDDNTKHEVVRKLRRAAEQAASSGVLLFLDSCEMPLATEDAARALAAILQHVVKLVPKAVLLIASRTVELQDLQGGKDVHPFHHAIYTSDQHISRAGNSNPLYRGGRADPNTRLQERWQ
ncbi:hypothetical protein DUNSADRAFT_9973 [Dunaliella salina]|uniref:AAA+ ATPase domain-containing protein n=1 Tax=Dunaliella salina TaxID=3046 RepID=A0ABQ7GGD3_DUNSA|nr:hypothetical protein DUNSADRAFT_9973 [Dunaliella salina]|eukprot:KAF5833663.1 hypothetical protein DUNSADRAFT_9973 [Dunaliella salina]